MDFELRYGEGTTSYKRNYEPFLHIILKESGFWISRITVEQKQIDSRH